MGFVIRVGSYEFSPGWIPTIAMLCVVALTGALGRWQLNRADEKRALQHQYEVVRTEPPIALTGREGAEAQHLQFRQLTAEGEFDAAKQIFLDNQVENERAGYYVLTPLRLADQRHYVLVNRGWIARGPEYPAEPRVSVPGGRLKVQGYGALPVKRFLELSGNTVQGFVWQDVPFERYERATGLQLLPVILVQSTGNGEGLLPVQQYPEFGITKHQGYAFQWFALSAAVIATYLFVNTQRVKKLINESEI